MPTVTLDTTHGTWEITREDGGECTTHGITLGKLERWGKTYLFCKECAFEWFLEEIDDDKLDGLAKYIPAINYDIFLEDYCTEEDW